MLRFADAVTEFFDSPGGVAPGVSLLIDTAVTPFRFHFSPYAGLLCRDRGFVFEVGQDKNLVWTGAQFDEPVDEQVIYLSVSEQYTECVSVHSDNFRELLFSANVV